MHFYTAVLLFAGAAFTNAASIQGRQQAPSAECTAARNRIVSALEDADTSIERIQDPATASAAASALEQAQDGIQQIAAAIRAGQAPPADQRNEVLAGLTALGQALAGADPNDAAVVETQEALDDAVAAGQGVVANC